MSGYGGADPGFGQAQRFTFIAAQGQSMFGGADSKGLTLNYKPPFVEVALNGLWLPPDDYTASDGSTISLTGGLSANDVVYVYSLFPFNPANALALDQNGADIPDKNAFASRIGVVAQCGRLNVSSATLLQFKPYNGDLIKINGLIYRIPAAGIAGLANTGVFVNGVAAANLAPNTRYWVYAFVSGGVVTADFSTTGHIASETDGNIGVEIKIGDNTRTLIGMVRTNGTSQFNDILTLSWFNRRSKFVGANFSPTTTSASFVDMTSGGLGFLTWGDELFEQTVSGAGNTNATATWQVCPQIDGGLVGTSMSLVSAQGFYGISCSSSYVAYLTEGYHTAQFAANTNGGTLAMSFSLYAKVRG